MYVYKLQGFLCLSCWNVLSLHTQAPSLQDLDILRFFLERLRFIPTFYWRNYSITTNVRTSIHQYARLSVYQDKGFLGT